MQTTTRRADLPMQVRLAPIGTVDKVARTADVVWTTGARVKQYDYMRDMYFMQQLSLNPAHVRMGRLQNGAPLLNAHNRWDMAGQIGVVEKASLTATEGTATVRFSAREDVQPIFQDVQDRIVRNVSVGFNVYRYDVMPPDDKSDGLSVYLAVDWEPAELSLVPVGADAGAGVRSEQQRTYPCEFIETHASQIPAVPAITERSPDMNEQERAAQAAAEAEAARQRTENEARTRAAADATRAAAEQATAAERARVNGIRALCTAHTLERAFEDSLIDDATVTLDVARSRVLDKLAERTTPVRSGFDISVTRDETDTRRAAMTAALLHRSNPGVYKIGPDDPARQYVGFTMREMMRHCLEVRGIRTNGMTPVQMWERTVSLSDTDLPQIVLDVANKTLRAAYDSSPRTFTAWAKQGMAPDFKNINRIQLSGAPSLLAVAAGGEIKQGTVTDGKETYKLATYARLIGIHRQTVINDDTNAFTRLPELFARAAADLESDTVYGIITANGTLADGTALFASGHNNLCATSGAISVAALGTGRAALRVQTGLEGRTLNLRPKFLIVPAAKEAIAEQFTSNAYQANVQTSINPFAAGGRAALTPVVEPRLDANSGVAWYMAADPGDIDTVEYSYLEGQPGVYLESRMGWEIDGIEMKVRLDFAAKALDYRGLYKHLGA